MQTRCGCFRNLGFSPFQQIDGTRFRSLSAPTRRFDDGASAETSVAMLTDCRGIVAASGRLADGVGRSASAASNLDGPDSPRTIVPDFSGAEELAEAGNRRRADLEPFGQHAQMLVDSRPGLAAGAIEPDAMMLVLVRERTATKSTLLESELLHGAPLCTRGNIPLPFRTGLTKPASALRSSNKSATLPTNPLTTGCISSSHKKYKFHSISPFSSIHKLPFDSTIVVYNFCLRYESPSAIPSILNKPSGAAAAGPTPRYRRTAERAVASDFTSDAGAGRINQRRVVCRPSGNPASGVAK
jgi:hypothetical protein